MYIDPKFKSIYRLLWLLKNWNIYKNYDKHIPKDTFYCYTGLWENDDSLQIVYCPFLKHVGSVLKENIEDFCMFDGSDCLGDACKTCGII